MTREEYFNELEKILKENEVLNAEEILKKCERRFDLARDAGIDIDEAIEMIGTPFEVYEKSKNNSEKPKPNFSKIYNLEVKGAISEDIIVKRNDGDKIVINIDEVLQPYTKINQSDNNIVIDLNRPNKINNFSNCTIEILVGNDIAFNKLTLASVSGDLCLYGELMVECLSLSAVSGDIKVDNVSGDTCKAQCVSGDIEINQAQEQNIVTSCVSGDITFGNVKTKECKVSTTSGDASARYIECDYASLNTLSGDINLKGKIKEKKARSFSGSINYCEVK